MATLFNVTTAIDSARACDRNPRIDTSYATLVRAFATRGNYDIMLSEMRYDERAKYHVGLTVSLACDSFYRTYECATVGEIEDALRRENVPLEGLAFEFR